MTKSRWHKFNARKTVVDRITFDSKAEAERYKELKLLERAGKIQGLTLQPKYLLQEGFTNGAGKKVRPIYYIADFSYTEKGKDYPVIEDVKGMRTQAYRLKKKMFEKKYAPLVVTEL